MGDRFPGVLGVTGEAEGLGTVEGNRVPHFARLVLVGTPERRLLCGLGLGLLSRGTS